VKLSPLSVTLLVAAGLGAGALGFGAARRAKEKARVPEVAMLAERALVLHVPHARGNIVLDGDMDDPGWQGSARTHAFFGPDGVSPARPHSEARLVWGDGHLYLGLYAADEDIRAKGTEHDAPVAGDDVFHVVFSDGTVDRVIEVSPSGVVADGTRPTGSNAPLALGWESQAHVSAEHDGTPNDPRDLDEEWVIEMAIPFEALGLRGEKGETIGLSLRRCDTLRSGVTLCGSWGEAAAHPEAVEPAGAAKKAVIVLD
jgi:hypothetical protein